MGTVVDEEKEVKGGKEVEPKRKRKRTKNQTKQNKSAD
jgi:hypothetical protein